MARKRKIDFVIKEDKYSKKVFRFYPRQSNVHGHHETTPPKTWDEVYKTYMAFGILETDGEGRCIQRYKEGFDECSCLDDVAYLIRNMDSSKGDILKRSRPFGNGTCWIIEKFTRETWESIYEDDEEYKEYESFYDFFIWHDYNGEGYRFQLDEKDAFKFADTIDEFYQHMLENSVVI